MQALGTKEESTQGNCCADNRDGVSPISYFIREGLSRPSLQMVTVMRLYLSTVTSHMLFLSGPHKQIPEGSDVLDILWLHWSSRQQRVEQNHLL